MKNKNSASQDAKLSEELSPLVSQIDDICDRLALIEAIGELFHIWKQFDTYDIELTTQTMKTLGFFFREEAFAIRSELETKISEKLSLLSKKSEAES